LSDQLFFYNGENYLRILPHQFGVKGPLCGVIELVGSVGVLQQLHVHVHLCLMQYVLYTVLC